MTQTSDSFRNVTKYLGQDYRFVPTYLRNRDPHTPAASPDIKPKEQQGHYPVTSLWTNTANQNIWALAGIVNNLGKWVLISSGGGGPMLMVGVPLGTSPITPDVNGLLNFTSTGGSLQITGSAGGLGAQNINFDITGGVAAIDKLGVDTFTGPGTNPVVPAAGLVTIEGGVTYATGTRSKPIRTNSLAANTMDLEIQLAGSNAAVSTANNFGVAQFDSNQFTVASGFVQVIGGGTTGAITKINVDASSPPGTNPVVPVSGAITITGGQVGAGTTANVIQTDSLAANTFTVQIQRTQASATSNVANNGVAHFNSTQFTVDSNGFVSIISATNYVQINHASSPYTVGVTDYYISCDPTAGVISILLPNAPTTFRQFIIKDRTGKASTNNISVTTVGGAVTIDGQTTYTMAGNFDAINLIFNGTSYEIY